MGGFDFTNKNISNPPFFRKFLKGIGKNVFKFTPKEEKEEKEKRHRLEGYTVSCLFFLFYL
jgi:hypothetical protein